MSDTACIFTYLPSNLEIKLPINGQLVLGRGTKLDIKSVHLSRRQVEITSVDGRVYASRQGANKSLLNGKELIRGRPTELRDGDSLTLLEKEYPIKISIPVTPAKAEPTPAPEKPKAEPKKASIKETPAKENPAKATAASAKDVEKSTPAPPPTSSSSTPVPTGVNGVKSKADEQAAAATDAETSNGPKPASNPSSVIPALSEANPATAVAAPVRDVANGLPVAATGTSEMELDHQPQTNVQKEPGQLVKSTNSIHSVEADAQTKTAARTVSIMMAGEPEDADVQEDGNAGRSSSSDDEHDSDRGSKKSRRESLLNRRKDDHTENSNNNNNNNSDYDELASVDDDAVMVENYLSDESSFVCSDLSDLEADGSNDHFDFAKVHKVKRQGRVEVLF
ncbi:hypothetical protein BGZ73_002904 [Actinomortierella ambigua]|nr:hypothetical protein BGZ73_002904 [Actinomortierella ambigua]